MSRTNGIKQNFRQNPGKTLNKEKTDLNMIIRLFVGHDSLFYKYSDAYAQHF
jgi:uncharacterized metal-binding protein